MDVLLLHPQIAFESNQNHMVLDPTFAGADSCEDKVRLND
jgi:hypothetical protein